MEAGTKNKPWRWEEDGLTVTRTASWSGPGCHNACGLLVYSKDNKIIKVEGDPDSPFNQGRLCVRCLSLPKVVHHLGKRQASDAQTPLVEGGIRIAFHLNNFIVLAIYEQAACIVASRT